MIQTDVLLHDAANEWPIGGIAVVTGRESKDEADCGLTRLSMPTDAIIEPTLSTLSCFSNGFCSSVKRGQAQSCCRSILPLGSTLPILRIAILKARVRGRLAMTTGFGLG